MDNPVSPERRLVERVRGDTFGPILFRTDSAHISSLASVADFSIHGVGLVVHNSVPAGTSLTIEAGPAGKILPAELTAEVRHATMLPDGRFFLGCQFSRSLSVDDVMALG